MSPVLLVLLLVLALGCALGYLVGLYDVERAARRYIIYEAPSGFVTCRCADCEQEFECYKSVQRYCPRCRGEPGSHYADEPDEHYEDCEALR